MCDQAAFYREWAERLCFAAENAIGYGWNGALLNTALKFKRAVAGREGIVIPAAPGPIDKGITDGGIDDNMDGYFD